MSENKELLEVKDLGITFFTDRGALPAVQEVSFSIKPGETLGVVGESGCGKSMTALSLMQLIPSPPGKITAGEIMYKGEDLLKKSPKEMRDIRGKEISMIFQEPMTSLNPVITVGKQIMEAVLTHEKMSKQEAKERALEMIKLVGIPMPEKVFASCPHQLSGGMRQRIMIAMALSCNPSLLICDEPTTALDVTIQAQILKLINKMKKELNTAVLLITHDMGVISEMADNVIVMYAGKIVEYTNVEDLFKNPLHPYTIGLRRSIPDIDSDDQEELEVIPGSVPMLYELPKGCFFAPRCKQAKEISQQECPAMMEHGENHLVRCWKYHERWNKEDVEMENNQDVLLKVEHLKKYYSIKSSSLRGKKSVVKAVDDISFDVKIGETFGIVGESGCGKSTMGKSVIRLIEPTEGKVILDGQDFTSLKGKELQEARDKIKLIFQDPYASLNPRMTVKDIIAEPIDIAKCYKTKEERDARVVEVMKQVGLNLDYMYRYPHEFSGGQRQRIGIARAIALQPKLIICDEPVSALDVSIQAKIINLLNELQEKMGIAYIFISHDLSVVKHIADRVGVMYLGNMMEMADTESLYAKPLHPYTQALFSAIPRIGKERIEDKQILGGDVPSPANPPKGCRFCTRCPKVMDICKADRPDFKEVEPGHFCAGH